MERDFKSEVYGMIGQILNLTSFDEINKWDEKAGKILEEITNSIEQLQKNNHDLEININVEKSMRAKMGFFKKIFSKNPITEMDKEYKNKLNYINTLAELGNILQDKIDFTPNDKNEKKDLISELKLKKKELGLLKKEISSSMTQIRQNARKESDSAGNSFGAFIGGKKYTAQQRRMIKHEKEMSLTPYENQKALIEKQILDIDKVLLWLEKIKD